MTDLAIAVRAPSPTGTLGLCKNAGALAEPQTDEVDCVAEDEIDLVVVRLRRIQREAGLDYTIQVGSLVYHYFFQGNPELLRTRGAKSMSFRRLAQRQDLPMSSTSLYRCVTIFELCSRLDVVTRWQHLTVSHLRTVLNLHEVDQSRLLAQANRERWSVRRLELEAQQLRGHCVSRALPSGLPTLLKCGRAIGKQIARYCELLRAIPDHDAASEARGELQRALTTTSERLALAERSLFRRASEGRAAPHSV